MIRRRHDMPFGAQVSPSGARFRLWAPGAARVELLLERSGGDIALPMVRLAGGWFELTTADAEPGSRYRFRLDGSLCVPDPASRSNPGDVHGASQVVDPSAYAWNDGDWAGRLWEEAVIYELHVGTFTPEGTFRAVIDRLDYLADLGITAIEIMPVADFPGRRNWGYDGVLLFAPDSSYGTPDDFKALIDAAHAKGLMVFLDVVYNHFGPEGNYLWVYCRPFFTDRHHTPWGSAINFDGEGSATVREFFIHNALYWLEEFHLDGLRLDAVQAIADGSEPHILTELAERVREGPGRRRRIHLVLEHDLNMARYLARKPDGYPSHYDAQWNDDFHHVLHLLLTGERDGYYADYADAPLAHLGRILSEGFAFQGETSPYRRGNPRGEPSRYLPPIAFVAFLQSHDQAGNRIQGERLARLAARRPLRAAATLLLLAPSPPLLFMGEEFACPTPFLYFCDFEAELAAAVSRGRREEFAQFERFGAGESAADMPEPSDPVTFLTSKLDWAALERPEHADWLEFHRWILGLRRRFIVPLLPKIVAGAARHEVLGTRGLRVTWALSDGGALTVLAHLGPEPLADVARPAGVLLAASNGFEDRAARGLANSPDFPFLAGNLALPAWTTLWFHARQAAESILDR